MIRSLVMLVVLAVVLVAALRFVNALATVRLSTVRVAGELSGAESDQVRRAVSDELTKPGWRTAADVASAVQGLGWVREVRVRRQWPDVLLVTVAHETVAAHWGDDAWLTTGGNVVPAPADPNDPRLLGLPAFQTGASDGPRAMRVFDMLNAPAQAAGLRIVRLDESPAGDWSTTFADGLQVVLGATDLRGLRERFDRFVTVYDAALRDGRGRVEYVDARYHTGVAVRWASSTALATAGEASAATRHFSAAAGAG